VTINQGLLTGLKLMHNNLKGSASRVLEKLGALESLGGISALQELNLASNKLTGALPAPVIAQFTSLVVCCLPFNQLEGHVSGAGGVVVVVVVVVMAGPRVCHGSMRDDLPCSRNQVPPTFSDCEGLAVLNLQGNKFTGGIPASLGRCLNLRVLHLYGNGLAGPLPPELSELNKLVELRLWDNQLTGP